MQRLTDRWLLYFGVLFILVVFFFPKGVIGSLQGAAKTVSGSNSARQT